MFKIKKAFFAITVILLALSFTSLAFATEIDIQPVLEGKEYYIMRLGEVQAFEAHGLGWNKKKKERIPNKEIRAIKWTFDSRFLELEEKNKKPKEETITLKAIKKRTSKLTVTGQIDGERVAKTIFIVIK